MKLDHHSICWRGAAVVVPSERIAISDIRQEESQRWDSQAAGLSPSLRGRVLDQLGIEHVAVHVGAPSQMALEAGSKALASTSIDPSDVDLIVDFSTLPGDHPAVWSLAGHLQGALGCTKAMAMAVQGSGCAGFHLALWTASRLMQSSSELRVALLIAADQVAPGGRSCLPISVLGDAASAVVLTQDDRPECPRLLSVTCTTLGQFDNIVTAEGCPPRVQIDAAAFERNIVPLHYVMSHRVLRRALQQAAFTREEIGGLVYPNTTEGDRSGVATALGLPQSQLFGRSLRHVGHAFASDMVINYLDGSAVSTPSGCIAFLAAGSGFTWGAAILDGKIDPR